MLSHRVLMASGASAVHPQKPQPKKSSKHPTPVILMLDTPKDQEKRIRWYSCPGGYSLHQAQARRTQLSILPKKCSKCRRRCHRRAWRTFLPSLRRRRKRKRGWEGMQVSSQHRCKENACLGTSHVTV